MSSVSSSSSVSINSSSIYERERDKLDDRSAYIEKKIKSLARFSIAVLVPTIALTVTAVICTHTAFVLIPLAILIIGGTGLYLKYRHDQTAIKIERNELTLSLRAAEQEDAIQDNESDTMTFDEMAAHLNYNNNRNGLYGD